MADNAIHWRAPQATPELIALVNDVRELRAVVQVALASADPREVDALTSTLIAGPPEACEPPLDANQPTGVLCKQALEARGLSTKARPAGSFASAPASTCTSFIRSPFAPAKTCSTSGTRPRVASP